MPRAQDAQERLVISEIPHYIRDAYGGFLTFVRNDIKLSFRVQREI